MTDSYNQGTINLLEGSPISVQTPDATPLVIQLGAIADDGSLAVDLIGGGSALLLTSANNYVVLTGDVIFTRSAGVGVVTPVGGPVVIAPLGLVPVLAFTVVDNAVTLLTECSLTITGPAAVYNHRLKFTATLF